MITVNCKDVLPIQHSLMIFIADRVEAIPASKGEKFILSPIENHKSLRDWQIKLAIEEYLDLVGKKSEYSILSKSDTILVKSKSGKKMEGEPPNVPEAKHWHYTWETRYSD